MKNSAQVVKQQFVIHGVSIREWALARGYSVALVYSVLGGKNKATRGQSFRIAVELGMRELPYREEVPPFLEDFVCRRQSR